MFCNILEKHTNQILDSGAVTPDMIVLDLDKATNLVNEINADGKIIYRLDKDENLFSIANEEALSRVISNESVTTKAQEASNRTAKVTYKDNVERVLNKRVDETIELSNLRNYLIKKSDGYYDVSLEGLKEIRRNTKNNILRTLEAQINTFYGDSIVFLNVDPSLDKANFQVFPTKAFLDSKVEEKAAKSDDYLTNKINNSESETEISLINQQSQETKNKLNYYTSRGDLTTDCS